MSARLELRVQPGAPRTGLRGRMADGTLKVAVAAPPEGGRANEAVVELVAELLGVARRQVRVARGASSRSKSLEIEGLAPEEVGRRIERALAGGD